MDEVQSWWEVPPIAHFCYAFRDAFNIIYFEIAELESAILNMQDPEMSISLEQLIIRLLQGCYDENDVRNDNWEEKLNELFEDNCEGVNPMEGACFHFLSPRLKVEVLYKLCEFRLDAEGALDAIKDIPAEDMKANCVGKDSQNNLYWYFCDERLYKEDPSVKPNKKTSIPEKSVTKSSTVKNKKRVNTRERKPLVVENKQWTITCHNMCDWEDLAKRFSKSKNGNEKELVNQIKNKYLPLLKEVVSEKDRLLRKRFLELAPKRNSSRISKVQAQKKLEEQKAAEAAEAKRAQQEAERVRKEAEKKINEKEERRRRAEERQKIVQGRSIRAKQREMMRGYSTDDGESSSEEINSRSKRACRSRKNEKNSREDDEEESSNEEEECGGETNSRAVRSKQTCRSRKNKQNSSEEDEEESSNEEEESGGKTNSRATRSKSVCRSRQNEQNSSEDSEDDQEESSNEEESGGKTNSRATRSKRVCRSRQNEQNSSEDSEDDQEESSNEEEAADNNEGNLESESANSSKNSSRHHSEDEDCSDKDSDVGSSVVHSISHSSGRSGAKPSVVRNTYNSKCNVEVDTKKQKVSSVSYFPENKRLKTNENSNYNHKTVNNVSPKDTNSPYHNWYLKACSKKLTNSPNIIRIDFIKPPPKPQG